MVNSNLEHISVSYPNPKLSQVCELLKPIKAHTGSTGLTGTVESVRENERGGGRERERSPHN